MNHTFASMEADDPNPYLQKHKEDAVKAWKLYEAERMLKEQHGDVSKAGSEKATAQ